MNTYPGNTRTTTYLDASATAPTQPAGRAVVLSVFEGNKRLAEVNLSAFGKSQVSFGSKSGNDVVLNPSQHTISGHHGHFELDGSSVIIVDDGSTNGLTLDGAKRHAARISPGDLVTVGKPGASTTVSMLISYGSSKWNELSLQGRNNVSIGRATQNDLTIPSPAVSAQHALMRRDQRTGVWFLQDCQSFNGTFVNGVPARQLMPLQPGSVIYIAGIPLVYLQDLLLVNSERGGVDVLASHLFMERRQGSKKRLTSKDVCLHIHPGEFVAIIGGSGSGKSTLLNELNGSDPATSGTVYVNGVDLYANYEALKNSIGYVPQKDIVYDNLTLVDMLNYSANLRMPPDSTDADKSRRVDEVIAMLELEGERKNFIGKLSGGQKKRASIAVELLADPRLLFLDEPTSGLDPGIEGTLMAKLAGMAHDGRTVILVTHTVANLDLCDKVVFMGPGGNLCYMGKPSEAQAFFGVKDYAEIYNKVAENVDFWSNKCAQTQQRGEDFNLHGPRGEVRKKETASFGSQLATLTKRYAQLVINDRARLVLLLAQAPVLAALICIVTGAGCFTVYEDTQSCLFAMSCAAFWVGILDSIQEICKERDVFVRECAGGMSVGAYVLSKVVVLGVLCIIQTALLTSVFCTIGGLPTYADGTHALINPLIELFVALLLTTWSAMCLGLLVSALFQNPDRAIAVAPILIMPQILFSGLIFELKGIADTISVFVNCRWSMEALGTTCNLNSLDSKLVGEEIDLSGVTIHDVDVEVPPTTTNVNTAYGTQSVDVPAQNTTIDSVSVPDGTTQQLTSEMYAPDQKDAFTFTVAHLMTDWGILILFCVVCVGACWGILAVRSRR